RRAAERSLVLPEAAEVRAIPGRGVMARIGRQRVTVGRLGLLDHRPDWFVPALARWEAHGMTIAVLLVENEPRAAFALADELRPESREAVAQLHRLGISAAMLTGDQQAVASWVARELGIDQFMAEVLPEDKQRVIRQLRQEGHVVAMVGDGINDAPALVAADLGIAIGAGTDIAVEASDVTLVGGDLRGVVGAIALSRKTLSVIRSNLVWAFAYNVLLLPVAAGGLFVLTGQLLNPGLAAAAMALSSVSVVTNSLRLRSFRVPKDPAHIARPPIATRVKDYGYLVGVATIAALLAAFGMWWTATVQAAAQTLVIDAIEVDDRAPFRFHQREYEIHGHAGEALRVVFTNRGETFHDWKIDEIPNAHGAARVGSSSTVIFRLPEQPGRFRIYCTVPGHAQLGMVAYLTIYH
ncbi:MAG: HAD-IC family P-type ATPase, partial [Dehalococcoidia bacterium]|nr:HAD-IC family P-type ATPase [Dehalococcoidia bacterium]